MVFVWTLGAAMRLHRLTLARTRIHGDLAMNVGHFEQISDCWSLEGQPATYYRTAAARARTLQADATTPGVRQYLDKIIAHCELLAGNVEPGAAGRGAGVRESCRRRIRRTVGGAIHDDT